MLRRTVLSMLVAGVAVAGCATEADGPAPAEVPAEEALLMGNPSCAEVARRLGRDLGNREVRAPAAELGELSFDARHQAAVVVAADGRAISWSADVGVDAVLVTGGRRTGVYLYDPEARAGRGLTVPHDKRAEAPPITDVAFCYDHELAFSSLSARTSVVRTQRWALELAPESHEVTVPAGTVKLVPFRLVARPNGSRYSGWTARGALELSNPSPDPVEVVAIGDPFHELKVSVGCKRGAPFVVPAFGSLTCPWSLPLPDGWARTIELEAVTRGDVGGAVARIPIDFGAAEVIVRDGRGWVWDEHAGFLGTVDDEQARVFDFDVKVGPYAACPAEGVFMDSATLYGHDTGARVEARTWLGVKVPCH